jgi:hypothetical protein
VAAFTFPGCIALKAHFLVGKVEDPRRKKAFLETPLSRQYYL